MSVKTPEKEKEKSRLKVSSAVLIAIFAVCAVLNGASWLSAGFSDWYRNSIFLKLQPAASGVSGIFPFSAGEIMICIAVFGGISMLVSYIILMLCKKGKRKRISLVYGRIIAWILMYITVTETMNCFIMYHCRSFASVYGISENTYSPEELYELAFKIAEKCNEASGNVSRDENGYFILTADIYSEADAAMNGISGTYSTLSGYYPKPKAIFFSDIMTKFNLLGIYFPFSMESNYNPRMYPVELPSTVCHEYAHLKGWIREDEANFISYLACVNSDDPDFVYSGYLSALSYLRSKVYSEPAFTQEEVSALYNYIDETVSFDIAEGHRVFIKAQESKAGTVMASVSDAAMETTLKLNGVKDGKKSYGRFVDLLLNYYADREV